MDKRALRKMEVSDPAEAVRARAAEDQELKWIVSYHKLDGGVDCICLYDAARIRKGMDGPRYLHFMGEDDYITRDMADSRMHWYTGKLCNVMNEPVGVPYSGRRGGIQGKVPGCRKGRRSGGLEDVGRKMAGRCADAPQTGQVHQGACRDGRPHGTDPGGPG